MYMWKGGRRIKIYVAGGSYSCQAHIKAANLRFVSAKISSRGLRDSAQM